MAKRTFRAVACAMVAALLAASCGGDDDGSAGGETSSSSTSGATSPSTTGGPTTSAAPDDIDPEGVLRVPWELVQSGGPQFDPTKSMVAGPFLPVTSLYDGLLRVTADGDYVPGLAKEVTVVDAQTIAIELHGGITFTDGTPLDAAAAKFSIERNRAANNGALSVELQDIADIVVDSPLEFTIELKSPIAGAVYDRLPFGDFIIVSPTAVRDGIDINTAPVGAGPFMLDRVEPNRLVRLKKNPDFFQADQIRLGAVEFVHVEAGPARVTAIQSGAVDATAQAFTYEQSKAIAATGWEIEAKTTDNIMLWGSECKSRPPFDDVRIRQALNHAIDRDAINAAVYDGKGEPMWGWAASDSPLHNDDLDDYYAHDVTKAKALLAEAGQPNLAFESFFTPGASQRAAEIIQGQVAAAGITMTIKPLTASADFFPDAKGAPINIFELTRTGIQKVARNLVPGSVGNICGHDDPELNALVNQIKGVQPGAPQAIELWHEMQALTMEKALVLFVLFGIQATAYDAGRLGDVEYIVSYTGQLEPNLFKLYVKS